MAILCSFFVRGCASNANLRFTTRIRIGFKESTGLTAPDFRGNDHIIMACGRVITNLQHVFLNMFRSDLFKNAGSREV